MNENQEMKGRCGACLAHAACTSIAHFAFFSDKACKECNASDTECFRCGSVFRKSQGLLASDRWFCSEKCIEGGEDSQLFCCLDHSLYICKGCNKLKLAEFNPFAHYVPHEKYYDYYCGACWEKNKK